MSGEARRLKERLDRLIEATKVLDDIPFAEKELVVIKPSAISAAVFAIRELRHIVRDLLEVMRRGGQLARA
jgi:hypothetical protein